MKIIGSHRVEYRMLARMRKGAITQLRLPAAVFDKARNRAVDSAAAKAQVGDLFWVQEDAVRYLSKDHFYCSPLYYCTEHGSTFPPDPGRPKKYEYSCEIIKIWAHRMRRAESKRCLQITAHRIERLDDLTAEDAEVCGVTLLVPKYGGSAFYVMGEMPKSYDGITPHEAFKKYYRFAYGAGSNPPVVAITFRLLETNVDAFLKQRRAA